MYDLLDQVNTVRSQVIGKFISDSRAYLIGEIHRDPTALTVDIHLPYPSKEVAELVAQQFNREGIITVTAHTYLPLSYVPSWGGRYYLICTVRSGLAPSLLRPSYDPSDSD